MVFYHINACPCGFAQDPVSSEINVFHYNLQYQNCAAKWVFNGALKTLIFSDCLSFKVISFHNCAPETENEFSTTIVLELGTLSNSLWTSSRLRLYTFNVL